VRIPIHKIDFDERYSPRVEQDAATVNRYIDALRAGNTFPPIEVGRSGDRFVVIDGRHRIIAHKACNRTEIEALLSSDPVGMWFERAVDANIKNGLPLSSQDQARIVQRLRKQGYDIGRISRLLATPKEVFTVSADQTSVRRIVPSTISSPVSKRRVVRDCAADSSNTILKKVAFGDILAHLIDLFESDKVPESLHSLVNRLYNAILSWAKRLKEREAKGRFYADR
jgi:hypothetical protein